MTRDICRSGLLGLGFLALAAPALAEGHTAAPTGDAAAGETQFARQCVSCHVVVNADGDTLAGRNARTGPNLFGIVGHPVGMVEGYRYGDDLRDVGETGVIWDEEAFVAYVMDPTGWLREQTGDRRARAKMAYQVRDAQQAADLYAYLHGLGD